MRHFAISAANFSISILVLQKQHSFKHKIWFSQVHEHKNQIKTILHTNFSYNTFEMQKKNTILDMQKMSLIEW